MKNSLKINGRTLLVLFTLILTIFIICSVNFVQAASITTNVTEATINSTVLINGTGFSANTNYTIQLLLENKSSWWDGYDEQWLTYGVTLNSSNESGYINSTGYTLAKVNASTSTYTIISVINTSNGITIGVGNYTISGSGILTNATAQAWQSVSINYTYVWLKETTIAVQTNGAGEFSYVWNIPYDWRVSGGKVGIRVGGQIASSLLWSKQGTNWAAAQPTKNGITGDSDDNGYVFTASNVAVANQGGIEKFSKVNGSMPCNWSDATVENINDVTNNGSILFAVTSAAANNLKMINMSNCGLNSAMTTIGVVSNSVNVAPDNTFIIITYAAGTAPRKYNITNSTPIYMNTFAPVAVASIGYDSCISPDGKTVYIGYANGNVTALNSTNGALLWTRNPPMDELGVTFTFPIYGLSCDADRVYVARGNIASPANVINQGFVEALWAINGTRAWVNSKTDTVYDNADVNNIRCDANYCYAVKTTPAIYAGAGIVGSIIEQLNKTNGNVTWWNWRSYLSTVYGAAYGAGIVHSSAQTLWIDQNNTGYVYPVYTNGWVQKIAKNDVNVSTYDPGLWIKGNTNFWNYIADVPKNIWLSNETPYYTFKHWSNQGVALNVSNYYNSGGMYFRFSNLNTFNSFTALETTPSLFIDPVIQTAVTQANTVILFNQTYAVSCPNTRYAPALIGWHYVDRACQYEEIPATLAGYNIGTTINGTYIASAVPYALIKTKFWDNYPITEYYGNDNWAWAAFYNASMNQTLGFSTKFGSDQEDVYSDNYGRSVLFIDSAAVYYYRPQFRSDLNRKSDNYIFFMPRGGSGGANGNFTWSRVDMETLKVANPVILNLSTPEDAIFNIASNNYSRRINFTAQEPNLLNRSNEPVEIIFNATAGIRSDCQDVIITDTTDTPILLWQVDNSAPCFKGNNISVWIMMNWTQNETKSLRLYYNATNAAIAPTGTTDLNIAIAAGTCAGNNQEINVYSSNWYNWTRPAAAAPANEITRFAFNESTVNFWQAAAHYQVANCYKNTNATGTGLGTAVDTCGGAAVPVSRCLTAGSTGKIFAKLNATVTMGAVANRLSAPATTLFVEYYFFGNTGRVRIRTQLNQTIPILNTTVSKYWPPYYYFSINGFVPPSGLNAWTYYSGLYDQMKRPVATFNADFTEANLSSSPLPLMFTIKYGGLDNISQASGNIFRPSTLNDTFDAFWGKGCTAQKVWQYYTYSPPVVSYGTAAAPLYTSEFITCSKDLAAQLPALGQPGYVNVIPEMGWDGTTYNKWSDPTLVGKFYMMPNLYRPYTRENRFLGPYATATGAAGDSTPYSTSARISSYIIPKCPTKEYGYKGYDDFLTDLPNLMANSSQWIRNNTYNIPCAVQVIKFTDQRGSDGINLMFARNLTVIVGETLSAGWTYPSSTYANGTYLLQPDGNLDQTFAQKGSATGGYFGKFYFTYTPNNYVMNSFATSGIPQFQLLNTPSTSVTQTAAMYTLRYQFAPEAFYTKNVFDESAFWNQKAAQNFTYYRNPCWLGRYDNIYGSTDSGLLATASAPGWQHELWGSATGAYSETCPRNTYNMEIPDTFRPGWGSKVPLATDTANWNEFFIDGRENFPGNGTPPGATDTYYIARHNSLWDGKHSDDFSSLFTDTSSLNQNEKQPNKQPWYCQISRHTNRTFCVMTSSQSSLIYNQGPGTLTITQGWSPYWSSMQEASTFRTYYVSRFGDTTGFFWPYDNILDVTVYPTLKRSEVLSSNLLYVSNNPDDYSTFFNQQFPVAFKSLNQNQFLLQDWQNSAFFVFDRDSRIYPPGVLMNVSGLVVRNGTLFANKNFNLSVRSLNGTIILINETSTNASGNFNYTYNLPINMSYGLYYVYLDYNNSEFNDSMSFLLTNIIASVSTDKAVYERGQSISTTILVSNTSTGNNTDPDQLELRYLDSNNNVMLCAKYPGTASVANCSNNLTRTVTGSYNYTLTGNYSLGTYNAKATVTSGTVVTDFTKQFVVAIIDPCKASSDYVYALGYPMSYDNATDTLTIIGNSTFGSLNRTITFDDIYAYGQAIKGTCIVQKPTSGTFIMLSRLIIGNGTQQVYVTSKGESIAFSSEAMPQLLINSSAHMIFGATADGIPQEGSNIEFKTNQTNDVLLDVAGGEVAFYDCYVRDAGNYWGRFMYRGSCGVLAEENSNINSSIIIKKTNFDRASKGQFFFTGNVTIDDMKVNRINSSSSEGHGLVFGCGLPVLNNIQIYHQAQNGSGIFISNNTPNNTNLIIQNSFLGYNTKDVIANSEGRGVTLVSTQWNRTYGFNWTDNWTGTTTIKESYSYLPTFLDTSSQGIENITIVLLDRFGNVQLIQKTNQTGEIPEQYVNTWQVQKTNLSEAVNSFNPFTSYAKKYGIRLLSEPKLFTTKKVEIKQMVVNPFTTKSELEASQLANITYNAPNKIIYGTESNSSWSTAGQLLHYPVDQCQYFAVFANDTLLSKDVDYTINYQTGAIMFLQNMTGYTVYPVYYYGGNVTITNGFSTSNAFSMKDIYDYTQYQTSKNNLTEDIYTVDGLTYNFCVDFVIGNSTNRGSVSDSTASVSFMDGYDIVFDGLGGYIDLAGIKSGGGSGGGLPLNIYDDVGASYAPGNTAQIFSTVLDSQGNLVDASVTVTIYQPDGTLYVTSSSTKKSAGRYTYALALPGNAQIGTWRVDIDATYSTYLVHDNVAFTVSANGGGGGGGGTNPSIEIDAPSTITANQNFGVNALVRNNNSLLTNCDGTATIIIKDNTNNSVVLNNVMTNTTLGQYNYTTSINYASTFLVTVNCSILGTTYYSNPTVITVSNSVAGGSSYPVISLAAPTPIATSSSASIAALVTSSTGTPVNCDAGLSVTVKNILNGSTVSYGTMSNFGTGMYNYTWTTPANASVFYVNASCQISGTAYTGFTLLSTQSTGGSAVGVDYNQIAVYVWNYTSRNLTYYNQSVSESIQSCLKDANCTGWWINSSLINIQNTINQINQTTINVYNNTQTLMNYLNCTLGNSMCANLQNILNNVTDIQARVYALNTSQIPTIKTSIDNIYNDTQYIRNNMVTISSIQDLNNSIWWLRNNSVSITMFNNNISDLITKLGEINSTTQNIRTYTNCSNPANSVLCTYLNGTNYTVNYIMQNMATYAQINNISNDTQWLKNNVATQTTMQNAIQGNFTEVFNRLNNMNTTIQNIQTTINCTNPTNSVLCTYLNTTNSTVYYITQNMATYAQINNISNDTQWLKNNVATQTTMQNAIQGNFTEVFNRLNNMNTTIQNIQTTINCTNPANSVLCTYLNGTNYTVNYIMQNMATYAQINNISNDTQWLKNNVATQTTLQNNFTEVINRISTMNSSLTQSITQLNATLGGIDSNLSSQIQSVQSNLTWIENNVATSAEISSNFTETFNRLNGINSTLFGIQGYLYTNVTNSLNVINNTLSNTQGYLYTNITNSLNVINSTLDATQYYLFTNTSTQSNITYLLSQITILQASLQNDTNSTLNGIYRILGNMSTQANITYILEQISNVQNDTLFIKNNMFYQGNATGNFQVDYASSVYTLPGDKADLWITTNDLLGNPKTVASATCSVMKDGNYISNATVSINSGGVHALWNIGVNQSAGAYYWNCTLTGSTMNIQVPFYVSSISVAQASFQISSLVAGSPRYPNEEALVEAVFSTNNGVPVDPDTINITIYDKNDNPWASANKTAFTKGADNIWSYAHSIENNPTTGMYTVHIKASYSGIEDSKSVQFRIATGGPYKVYLDCPTSTNIGQILYCNVILKDEGEVGTESISTVWIDTDNNGTLDTGEPQISFSKRTTPFQNVTQQIAINVPSTQPTGLYVVRVNTSYVGSSQPDSQASASVVFNPAIVQGPPSAGPGGNGGTGLITLPNITNESGTTAEQPKTPPHQESPSNITVGTKGIIGLSTKTIEGYTNVKVGDKIMEEIDLYNLGNEPIKNALLTYCLVDLNYQNVTPCNQESVSFETKTQLLKKIILPQYVRDGTYFFYVKVDYNGDFVDSKDDFKVATPGNWWLGLLSGGTDSSSLALLMVIFMMFIVLILIVLIALLVSKKSETVYLRDEREKNTEKKMEAQQADAADTRITDTHATDSRVKLKSNDLAAYKVYADAEREDLKMEIEYLRDKISKDVPPLKVDEALNKFNPIEVRPKLNLTEIMPAEDVAAEKKPEKEVKHIPFRNVDGPQAFYFCNGEKARNVLEFINIIKYLNEEQFLFHVNYHKNDFAKWLGGVFGYYEMAEQLTKVNTKDATIKVLESYKVDT